MSHKDDLYATFLAMQDSGEYSNLVFVDAPWYKRVWSEAKKRWHLFLFKRMLKL